MSLARQVRADFFDWKGARVIVDRRWAHLARASAGTGSDANRPVPLPPSLMGALVLPHIRSVHARARSTGLCRALGAGLSSYVLSQGRGL
jgi:hypothetical protein